MRLSRLPRALALGLLRCYQQCLSPLLGRGKCRFYPTCSEYARQAIERYGLFRGGWLALCRICRCHPFNHDPYDDPVPEILSNSSIQKPEKDLLEK